MTIDTDQDENFIIEAGDKVLVLTPEEAEELLVRLQAIFIIRNEYKIELDT